MPSFRAGHRERGLSFVGLLARHGLPLLTDASPSRPWALGGFILIEDRDHTAIKRSAARGGGRGLRQAARAAADIHFISYRLPFRLTDFQENICFHR
jgi:hypothetical protein